MALRVRVELVPHGMEAGAKVLDEIVIGNNGTGVRGGPDEGGIGNYDVYDIPLAQIQSMDYPEEKKLGEIRGLPRSPEHRLILAELALAVANESRKTGGEDAVEMQVPKPDDASAPDPEFDREEEQDARG